MIIERSCCIPFLVLHFDKATHLKNILKMLFNPAVCSFSVQHVGLANGNSTLFLISVIFRPLFFCVEKAINNKITHPHCNLLIKIFNWLLLARQPLQLKNRIRIAFLLPRINRGCGDAKSLINNLIEIFNGADTVQCSAIGAKMENGKHALHLFLIYYDAAPCRSPERSSSQNLGILPLQAISSYSAVAVIFITKLYTPVLAAHGH